MSRRAWRGPAPVTTTESVSGEPEQALRDPPGDDRVPPLVEPDAFGEQLGAQPTGLAERPVDPQGGGALDPATLRGGRCLGRHTAPAKDSGRVGAR